MESKPTLDTMLFDALAEASSTVFFWATDIGAKRSRWSKATVDYFNLPSEYTDDAVGDWTKVIHPDDLQIWLSDAKEVVEGKKARYSCQYRAKNRYGEYVWVENNGYVLNNENGEHVLSAGMITRLDVQNRYDPQTNMLTTYAFYSEYFFDGAGTVLMLNVDDFRNVISTYGYSAAKELVGQLGALVKEACNPSMKLYRFGTDEFMIILPGGTKDSTRSLFNKIADAVRMSRVMNGTIIRVSISGAAVMYPEDCVKKDDMVEKLDYSMGYVKKHHPGKMTFYSEQLAREQERKNLLKEDLIQSVQNEFKGFSLFFQPLVEPVTERINGAETLLRWKGEVIQDSYPAEFIDILEETGYIRQVGLWVMEQTFLQKKAWEEKYGNLQLSFNVSYQQFMDQDFAAKVIKKANEIGVDKESVIIELTESCQVKDPESLANVFEELEKEGFKLALDDFGTAYSTMEMLRKLPIDYIKIDHSFVRELADEGHEDDYIIVDELVRLSNRLHHGAIIEGVENQSVVERLKDVNASLLQGYHYSKPVSKDAFEGLLDKQKLQAEFVKKMR